ncbi:Mut7-C RNAse domain-containing protein [Halorussus litoreus]|uniref:Mut7-C RNAse domain-containing protein n=1 Tax=Halorussus litoreus TaxID=1710536 RepID=UPI000E2311EB|nr:Mut7-C RNAse domain-containing protein [Halorussus litoreus]
MGDDRSADRRGSDRSPDQQASAGTRRPSADTALLLDVMLGKLSTYLRMCGYDAAYALDREARSASERPNGEERCDDPRGVDADDELLELAESENRLLVTRDVELARRADGLLLETTDVTDQLRELADAGFALELSEPSRCASCNGQLERLAPATRTPEHAPDSQKTTVWRCRDCGQHFWKGSHWESVAETLSEL